jgi:peptidoglycan hydrolase-like protein with peptidoglycan-binding domain
MRRLIVGILVGMLWLWPAAVGAADSGRASEQLPEQQRLLTKDEIRQVQERLKAEGVDPGPADGVLNAQTQAALREYQNKRGLPVSGAPDQATLRELQIQTLPGGAGER